MIWQTIWDVVILSVRNEKATGGSSVAARVASRLARPEDSVVAAVVISRPASLVRSLRSGPWSAASTWEGGAFPGAGARVQVRRGHVVTYDLVSDLAIRSIHVAGTLEFSCRGGTKTPDCILANILPMSDPANGSWPVNNT